MQQHQNEQMIEHHRTEHERQHQCRKSQLGAADTYTYQDYEAETWSYYRRHTTLVWGALAATGVALVYFNKDLRNKVDGVYLGSW